MNQKNIFIKKLVYSAMFLAMALVFPFITGQLQSFGAALCHMHVPVLLCGFICGARYGAAVGAAAPILRFALFGMPVLWSALPMAFELCAYGLCAGLLYKLLPKKAVYTYISLVCAMLCGRIIWGFASAAISGLRETAFGLKAFWLGAFAGSVPGIIIQIILVPVVVLALKRAKLMLNE
jgi:riboflavin transporter FmnP